MTSLSQQDGDSRLETLVPSARNLSVFPPCLQSLNFTFLTPKKPARSCWEQVETCVLHISEIIKFGSMNKTAVLNMFPDQSHKAPPSYNYFRNNVFWRMGDLLLMFVKLVRQCPSTQFKEQRGSVVAQACSSNMSSWFLERDRATVEALEFFGPSESLGRSHKAPEPETGSWGTPKEPAKGLMDLQNVMVFGSEAEWNQNTPSPSRTLQGSQIGITSLKNTWKVALSSPFQRLQHAFVLGGKAV